MSYEKVVKLACKPKAAAPKSKYIEPIIAATWSEDGAVHDVCKALSPRFREPNTIVVFKALIVLHTMIRNGSTDNVLSYLSSSEVLRLKNVSAGNWDGYAAPENLQSYATYLDSRIRAYKDLKHDAIRVQAESNRDMRTSNGIEDDSHRGRSSNKGASTPTRSKTVMGRKLRVMTVEKGLLRETRTVHRMIDALLECKFYHDNLDDELTVAALRMLVKDLLILFQAGNEGVINVLEHYFEMSFIDAKDALSIYRHFCKQTERVVEFLGVARKLQNLLNVSIPNLKHAPVSLAGALQEYLDDPNFEQNRIEYRTNKEAADRSSRNGGLSKKAETKAGTPPVPKLPTSTPASTASASTSNGANSKNVQDFFSAIDEEQTPIFNGQPSPNMPHMQQQQAAPNPFVQRQMMTGQPFMQPQMQMQPTDFAMPQQAPNPFGFQPSQSLQPQPTGHRPFSSFMQPQATGFMPTQQPMPSMPSQPTGFLQPQQTGSNPFRQSMMFPQSTGFGGGLQSQINGQSGFGTPNSAGATFGGSSFPPFATPMPSSNAQPISPPAELPARPSSTPLTSFNSAPSLSSPPAAQPVKTHTTGTRNPFGPVVTPAPPVPKAPTLMELMSGSAPNPQSPPPQSSTPTQQASKPQPTGLTNGFSFDSSALNPGTTDISSVASSFSFNKPDSTTSANGGPKASEVQPTLPDFSKFSNPLSLQNTSTTSSGFSDSMFSSLSFQPTGTTGTSSTPSSAMSPPLRPTATGFSGLKPFKPSSSFGATLMDSLPPIPQSSPTSPVPTGSGSAPSNPSSPPPSQGQSPGGLGSSLNFSNFPAQTTGAPSSGSTLGVGLRPQMTGGAANPFRASMMGLSSNPTGVPSFNPAMNSMPQTSTQPFGSFSAGNPAFGNGTGQMGGPPESDGKSNFGGQMQHQNGSASLI